MNTPRPEGWQRLHPLSPVVRGGRATIAIFILLIPIAFGGDTLGHATPQFAVIAVIVLACVVLATEFVWAHHLLRQGVALVPARWRPAVERKLPAPKSADL